MAIPEDPRERGDVPVPDSDDYPNAADSEL